MQVSDPAGTPAVRMEVHAAVLWVHLQRPQALNAVNSAVVEGIDVALDRASHSDVRALVIRGTGRAFSAGADLRELPGDEIDIPALEAAVHRVDRVVARLAALPKPVVAGVNGIALAGGLEIILACDLVVAAESARLGDSHVNYGLLPGAGGTYRLPAAVGPAMAKKLMLTGELFDAADLVSCGLVTRVVPDDALDAALRDLSTTLARRSPRVLAAMKRLINDSSMASPHAAAAEERTILSAHLRSADVREGLTAFREGRTPVFADDLEFVGASEEEPGGAQAGAVTELPSDGVVSGVEGR